MTEAGQPDSVAEPSSNSAPRPKSAPGHPPKTSLLSKLGLILAASAVALVAAELVIDRWFPIGAVIYHVDPDLLHDALPHAARIQPMGRASLGPGDAARVHISTGELGFRGGLPSDHAATRVLVLGDSLVMAENAPFEATFARRLGAELSQNLGADVVSLNAGRSGYGPDQALLLFERVVEPAAPDAVVVVLCAHNDFGDLMRNKLVRNDGGELERLHPRVGARVKNWFALNEHEAGKLALVRFFKFVRGAHRGVPEERIEGDVMPLYLAALGAQFDEHWVRRDTEVVSLLEDIYDADIALGVAPERTAIKRALMEDVLREFTRVARAHDLPIAFVVLPSAVDVHPGFGLTVDGNRYPGYDAVRLTALMLDAARSTGAPAFDLTESVAGEGRASTSFVGGTDIHWNASGQGLGATAVAAWLAGFDDWAMALRRY